MTYECIEHAAKAVAEEILANADGGSVFITRPDCRTGFINLIRAELARENRLSIVKEKDDMTVVIAGEAFGSQDIYLHLAFSDGSAKNIYLNICPARAGASE